MPPLNFMVATEIRLLGMNEKATSWKMFALRPINQLRDIFPLQVFLKYHLLL